MPADPKKLKRRVLIAIAIIFALMIGSFAMRMIMMKAMGMGPPGFKGEFPVAVMAEPPRVEKVENTIDAVGNLRAENSIMVAPEVAGRIIDIPGQEGTAVKAGDVLVRLDPAVTEADVAQARASVELARANAARATNLAQHQFGTMRAKDEALAALHQSEAQLSQALARLGKMVITAPFDGLLGLREKSIGAYVKEGDVILTLSSINPMLVEMRAPELKSAAVQPGQSVTVTIDALGGKPFAGLVTAADPDLDAAGHSLRLRAKIDNPEGILKAGMFARVKLSTGAPQEVFIVPERSVYFKSDGTYVYRAVEGKAAETKVTVRARRVGEVEISEGLKAGEDVVTDGQIKIHDGSKLLLLNKPNVPADAKAMPSEEKNARTDGQEATGKGQEEEKK
jgi:membrane fusion protein (multidrug efflux system)